MAITDSNREDPLVQQTFAADYNRERDRVCDFVWQRSVSGPALLTA